MTDGNKPLMFAPDGMDQSPSLWCRRLLQVGCYAALAGLVMSNFGKVGQAPAASGGQVVGRARRRYLVGEYLRFRRYRDSSGVVHST
jgi:hypothetical protein